MTVLAILVSSTFSAAAATVHPVSGTTTASTYFGGIPNVIDGVIDFDQNWGIFAAYGSPTAVFDLGGTYDLTEFLLWNNGGNIQFDGEGVRDFTLVFRDQSNGFISSFGATASDVLTPQTFSLGGSSPTGARYVEFDITSNWGASGYAVIYEAAFTGDSSVPEPASAGLMALAGLLLWSARSRLAPRR